MDETAAVLNADVRRDALARTGLLDTLPEESFDRLTRMATRLLKAPVALVTFVDQERQFFKSSIGLPEGVALAQQTPLTHSFCQYVMASASPLVIADAREHPILKDNPAIRDLGVVAYLGFPLVTSHGLPLGALCVIDHEPRVWSDDDKVTLGDLASSVMTEIELKIAMREAMQSAAIAERGRQEMAALLDASVEGILGIDIENRCTYANRAAHKLLGYDADEYLGKNMHALIHHSYPDGSPYPADACPVVQAFSTGCSSRLIDEVVWRKDGQALPVSVSCAPVIVKNHVVGAVVSMIDVSERKQAELKAGVAQQRVAFLADASKILAGTLDYSSTLQSIARLAVPTLADWCGVDVLDDAGEIRSLAIITADPARQSVAEELQRRYPVDLDAATGVALVLRSGEPMLVEHVTDEMLVVSARDGEHARLMLSVGLRSLMAVPLRSHGRIRGCITFGSTAVQRTYTADDLALAGDLADRCAMAIEHARLYREAQERMLAHVQLNSALQEAIDARDRAFAETQAAERTRDAVVGAIAHDLMNPIASMKGSAQFVKRVSMRGEQVDRERVITGMQRIETAAAQMSAQVEELFDLSHAERGTAVTLRLSPADLVLLVRQTVAKYSTSNDERLRFVETVSHAPGVWDAVRIGRVIDNLLSNALKYSPDGGAITVTVTTDQVDTQPWAVLQVRDQGIGINSDDLPRVFERYHRGRNVIDQFKGSGIGLSGAKQIVGQHGGTIELASTVGVGTTVTVRLPATSMKPENHLIGA